MDTCYNFDWRFDYNWVRDGIPWFRYGEDRPNPTTIFEYNQAKLSYVRRRLAGVSREAYLKEILQHVLSPSMPPQEQVERLIRFVQDAMWHPPLEQPMEPGAERWADYYANEDLPLFGDVSDPAGWPGTITEAHVLLELHEGRCGHHAQVLMQLCQAAGFRARVLQLHHHRVTEVFYEGEWHFCDADVFKHGVIPRRPDGTLPTLAWLTDPEHIYLADALPPDGNFYRPEQLCNTGGQPVRGAVCPSFTSGQVMYYSGYFGAPAEYPPAVPCLDEPQIRRGDVLLGWAATDAPGREQPRYDVDLYQEGEQIPFAVWRELSATQVWVYSLDSGRYRWTVRAVDGHRQRNPNTWYYPAEGMFVLDSL